MVAWPPTESAFIGKVATINRNTEILGLSICHSKVDFDLDSFATVWTGVLVETGNCLRREHFRRVSELDSDLTLFIYFCIATARSQLL